MKKSLATAFLVVALIAVPATTASAFYPDTEQETNVPATPQNLVTVPAPVAPDVQLETEALPEETAAPVETSTPAPTDEELETLAQSDDPANLIWLWFGAGAVALVLALLLVFLLRRKKEQPEEA